MWAREQGNGLMWGWWTKLPRPIRRVRLVWTGAFFVLLAFMMMLPWFRWRPAMSFWVAPLPALIMGLFGRWERRVVNRASRAAFLICPRCEYSLADVVETRCPECGTGFTPASLRTSWLVHGEPKP